MSCLKIMLPGAYSNLKEFKTDWKNGDTETRVKLICDTASSTAVTLFVISLVAAAVVFLGILFSHLGSDSMLCNLWMRHVVPIAITSASLLGAYLISRLINYIASCSQRAKAVAEEQAKWTKENTSL